MDQVRLNAQARTESSKGFNRRLRRDGQVLAIIYGGKQEPEPVTINAHELELILRGARRSNAIFSLSLNGQEAPAIIRDIQRHPVTGTYIHVDFQRVDMTQELEVEVPLHAAGGVPAGVRDHGILEQVGRTVLVRCLPGAVPKAIEADLTNLGMNQSYHASDLVLPEGVTMLSDGDTPLWSVKAPTAEAAPAGAAEGAAGEPEVITERKATES